MSFEYPCPQCQAKLRIGDENASRATKCPSCSHVFQPQAPVTAQTTGGIFQERWQVRLPDGRTFGPSARNEIIEWIQQSRVPPGSQVCREGDSEWIDANLVFGGIISPAASPAVNPSTNPYQAPTSAGGYVPSSMGKQHRGGVVLTLGLVGLVSTTFGGFCCLFAPIAFASPIAWYLGKSDLREMDAGMMDPQGRSITMAGMICGIIGTIFLALGLVVMAGFFMFAIFQEM